MSGKGKAKLAEPEAAPMAERECGGGYALTPIMKATRQNNLALLHHALDNVHSVRTTWTFCCYISFEMLEG